MASQGGFLSVNRNLDPSSYPDDTTRELAREIIDTPEVRFDLSDLTPQAFGGGTDAHMWVLLQNFLDNDISPTDLAQQLEDAAVHDFAGRP
jgi:alpha-glucoside transport system substrate-binding protein